MFPGLVIWNKTTRVKKTWSLNSLPCLWLLHICEREVMNAAGHTIYWTLNGKLSRVCHHKSPAGFKDEAILREIAS